MPAVRLRSWSVILGWRAALAGTGRDRGASAVEYGLLVAGIAAIVAGAIFAFGGGSTGTFQNSCKTVFVDRSVGSCS